MRLHRIYSPRIQVPHFSKNPSFTKYVFYLSNDAFVKHHLPFLQYKFVFKCVPNTNHLRNYFTDSSNHAMRLISMQADGSILVPHASSSIYQGWRTINTYTHTTFEPITPYIHCSVYNGISDYDIQWAVMTRRYHVDHKCGRARAGKGPFTGQRHDGRRPLFARTSAAETDTDLYRSVWKVTINMCKVGGDGSRKISVLVDLLWAPINVSIAFLSELLFITSPCIRI